MADNAKNELKTSGFMEKMIYTGDKEDQDDSEQTTGQNELNELKKPKFMGDMIFTGDKENKGL